MLKIGGCSRTGCSSLVSQLNYVSNQQWRMWMMLACSCCLVSEDLVLSDVTTTFMMLIRKRRLTWINQTYFKLKQFALSTLVSSHLQLEWRELELQWCRLNYVRNSLPSIHHLKLKPSLQPPRWLSLVREDLEFKMKMSRQFKMLTRVRIDFVTIQNRILKLNF